MWWEKYTHIPFKDKGRDASGVDCWGLVGLIYQQELGIVLPDYLECYETSNDRDILSETIRNERCGWQSPHFSQEFDVIILRMRGVPMHVGVVTVPGKKMIHCARGMNTCHEDYTGMRWRHSVEGFARWKN